MRRSVSHDNFDYLDLETDTFPTIIETKSYNFIHFLIIFLIFVGIILLIALIVGLVFIYMNCTCPGRIHKKIPIEYLDTSETNDTPT